MPYIDLVHGADTASIWYETNSALGTVNNFDPAKPTVALLHPMFLCSSWMSYQLHDFRLKSAFNMIAFDHRSSGNSYNKHSPAYDSCVQAADIAYCFQYLCLPPVHLIAAETMSVCCALRFVSLFPDMVLSLTLINIPAPTELKFNIAFMDELMQMYCYAQDLDTLEHCAKQICDMMAGPDCDPDLVDELIAWYEIAMPPIRRTRCVQHISIVLNRTPMPDKMYESITCPVLILQSESSPLYKQKDAQDLAEKLVNCQRRPVIYTIKDTKGYVTVRNPSIVNQTIYKFLTRLPHARSDITPPQIAIQERMRLALAVLGEYMGDKSFVTREPLDRISSLTFSCASAEVRKRQYDMKVAYSIGALEACNPLRPNGRPIRKYSESKENHWFHSESNSLSYAENQGLSPNSHKGALPTRTDPYQDDSSQTTHVLDPDVAKDGRMRRTNSSAIDKAAIKGSMAKVVATTPKVPRMIV